MKKNTVGVFPSREKAEKAIHRLHTDLGIPHDDISYLYRNTKGKVQEVETKDMDETTPGEGAGQGAMIGGSIGAIAGLATIAGIIPVIGPIFAAGPLIAALGIGAGAVATTAAGAVTGAAAGGIIGALVAWGVGSDKAKEYESSILAGNVLVAVQAEEGTGVSNVLSECGASHIDTYHTTT